MIVVLPFFCFRWVEDKPVAERLLELWPSIVKMVNHWEGLPKSKRPSSKSYANALSAVNDNLIPVKLYFFSFVAGIFQPFLVKYQSDKPVVPFLHDDLLRLVKRVLLLVLKPDVNPCTSITELKKNDSTEKANFLKAKEIELGFGARECFKNLKESDLLSSQNLQAYMNECVIFVTDIASKLFDTNPLGFVIMRNADALTPNVIADLEAHLLERKMNQILLHLLKLNILSSKDSDKALEQYSSFLEQVKKMHLNELKQFDVSKTDLDFFYFHELGIETKNMKNLHLS